MDPQSMNVAVMLATPAGLAVVGSLLWWRMSVVEREVRGLRDDKHTTNASLARMQGATQVIADLVHTLVQQRGK